MRPAVLQDFNKEEMKVLFFPVAVANAADAPTGILGGGSGIMGFAPLVVLFVIFYFLLIRPQQKKAKEHKQMLSEVEKGDSIVTTGGIFGRVISVSEDTLMVEVADNVKIKIARDAVALRKPKG